MWTDFKTALHEYPQMQKHIDAICKYRLPWDPIDRKDARDNLSSVFTSPIYKIEVNTPSIGGVWTTSPVYKYISECETVFVKCGKLDEIINIYKVTQHMRSEGVSTAAPLGIYTEQNETRSPKARDGGILVTEFLNSISLGLAIVDVRFCINCLRDMVHTTINSLHKEFTHGNLTYKHIRVCVGKEDIDKLKVRKRARRAPQIQIKKISIIGPTGITRRTELNRDKEIEVLRASAKRYLTRLTRDKNISQITSLTKEERERRYKSVLGGF